LLIFIRFIKFHSLYFEFNPDLLLVNKPSPEWH